MTKTKRNIIKIDEKKCNGCGACIPACKEGALQIIDGKARLIGEIYCDGLGACLGKCPQNAITIEERIADEFDEQATARHTGCGRMAAPRVAEVDKLPCGCPGTMTKTIERKPTKVVAEARTSPSSELRQWPIQLMLVPVNAPYLKNADLVLLADCVAVAYANLHEDFIKTRAILMACPKLDNQAIYIEKLAQMIEVNNFRSIEVAMMEVPCCNGLKTILNAAMKKANSNIEITESVIGIEGNKL